MLTLTFNHSLYISFLWFNSVTWRSPGILRLGSGQPSSHRERRLEALLVFDVIDRARVLALMLPFLGRILQFLLPLVLLVHDCLPQV